MDYYSVQSLLGPGGGQGFGAMPPGPDFGIGAPAAPAPDIHAAPPKMSRWEAIGTLGDILARIGHAEPIYGPYAQQQQEQQQAALAQEQQKQQKSLLDAWLADPNNHDAFTRSLIANPTGTLAIRKGLEGDPHVLGQGDTLVGGQGQPLAQGAPKPPALTVIDGIAFNSQTGEPMFETPYPKVYEGPQGAIREQPRIGLGRPITQPSTPTISDTPAPQVGANGQPTTLTQAQYQAIVAAKGQAAADDWAQRNGVRVIVRTGTANGRRVVQYSDGTIDYAN